MSDRETGDVHVQTLVGCTWEKHEVCPGVWRVRWSAFFVCYDRLTTERQSH